MRASGTSFAEHLRRGDEAGQTRAGVGARADEEETLRLFGDVVRPEPSGLEKCAVRWRSRSPWG